LELLFFNKIEKFVVDGRRVEGTSKDKRSTSYLLRSSGKISFEPIEFGGNCSEQVCQMLYQYWAKNTNLVFLVGLRMENGLLECFTTIWHIVWRVGIFCGDLVHVSRFGIFGGDLVYLCFPFWYIVPRKIWQPWSRTKRVFLPMNHRLKIFTKFCGRRQL
jgi:hypothetical protein